ncbi:MAG: hypothetical protein SGARI_006352, partial [Bacillariaceae sp.]
MGQRFATFGDTMEEQLKQLQGNLDGSPTSTKPCTNSNALPSTPITIRTLNNSTSVTPDQEVELQDKNTALEAKTKELSAQL